MALITSAKGVGTTNSVDTTGANLLVAYVSYFGAPATILSDSKGNTWTALTQRVEAWDGTKGQAFYCVSPTVGSGHTFSSPQQSTAGVEAIAFDDAITTATFDAEVGANTTTNNNLTLAAGPITPGQTNSLLVAFLGVVARTGTTPAATASSGWTLAEAQGAVSGTSYGGAAAYQIIGAAAAKSITWTWASNTDTVATAEIAVFKVNSAPSSAPVLSSPTGAATGPTQATIGLTTDTAPTTTTISYQILAAATGAPSAATIVGAPDGTITTGSAGALTKAITGLTTNTAVKVHFAQGASSNVVSSASFTPSTLAWSGTYPNQSGVAGAAFVHTGSVPSPTGGIGTKSYSATGLGASGLTMNSSTGQLQGTNGTAGTYSVTPTVVDQSTVGSSIPQTQSLAAFTLTISAAGSAPTVSANPSNLTVADGATATFSGGFNGSPTLSLQWQEFITGVWTAMSGETNINLSLGVVDLLDNGRSFRLGCTNPYGGPIYTSSATLTVSASSVGTITSDVLADWGDDTPLASTNIEFVTLLAITDDTVALQLVDQVTNTAGRLIIADAAITTGDDYLLVTRNADGSVCGCKAYTAT